MSLDIEKLIKCCFCEHYAYDAQLLPCKETSCKKCTDILNNDVEYDLYCDPCGDHHSKDDIKNMIPIAHVKYLIESNMNDLKSKLINDLKTTKKNYEDFDEKFIEEIDEKLEIMQYQLDLRIECIISELHEYREDFMKEMIDMKEKIIKSVDKGKFEEMRRKVDDILKKNISSFDYENFMKLYHELNEAKDMLDGNFLKVYRMNFDSEKKIVYKDIVGELTAPFGKCFGTENAIVECGSLEMTEFSVQAQKQLVAISEYSGEVTVVNLDDGYSDETFKHENIKFPKALCIGKDDKIFIVNRYRNSNSIVIFDKDFNYENEIELNDVEDKFVYQISVDLYDKQRNLIYVSYGTKLIHVWDIDDEELVRTINIGTTGIIKFTKEYMYTIDDTFVNTDKTGRIDKEYYGTSAIFILNKKNHEIIDKITFDDWIKPLGLEFDEDGNMLTIAHELDRNKIVSNNRYLYLINKNKELIQKIKINEKESKVCDFLFVNKKLYFLHKTFIVEQEMDDIKF